MIPYKRGCGWTEVSLSRRCIIAIRPYHQTCSDPSGIARSLRSHRAEDPAASHLRKVTGGLHIQLSKFRKENLSLYISGVDVFSGFITRFCKFYKNFIFLMVFLYISDVDVFPEKLTLFL